MSVQEDIAEVRRLDKAATKGPWTVDETTVERDSKYRDPTEIDGPHEGLLAEFNRKDAVEGDRGEANARLAASFRTAAPRLADACEDLLVTMVEIAKCTHPDCRGGKYVTFDGALVDGCEQCEGTGVNDQCRSLLQRLGVTVDDVKRMKGGE